MRARQWRLPSICLFLFALLVGQALGLVHGVAHMEPRQQSHAAHHGAEASGACDGAAGEHWAAGLFGHHAAGSGDCLVAGHGLSPGLLSVPAVILPQPGALPTPALLRARAPDVASSTYFSARAPPAFG